MQLERNKTAIKSELYLKQKIRANINAIVDCRYYVKDIKIKRPKLLFIWSGRELYYVDIIYLVSNSLQHKKLVIKKVYNAKKTFKEHKWVLDESKKRGIRPILPEPYFYIEDGNYVVTEYINGKPLLEVVLLKLSHHSSRKIFIDLGISLANFHNLSRNYKPPIILRKVVKGIIQELRKSEYFDKEEKLEIEQYLLQGIDLLGPYYKIPVSRLYNDWTLRNFIVNRKLELKVIDSDAMVHPRFPSYDIIWNDISTFLMNLESQTKYYPLINKNYVLNLEKYFLDGYNATLGCMPYSSDEVNFLHYLTALKFYLGMVERPLSEIYKGNLNSRFMKRLKGQITIGSGSVLGKFY